MQSRPRVLFLSDHLGHAGGVVHGATRYFLTVLPRIDRSLIDLTVCFLHEPHPAAAALQAAGIEPIFFGRAKWDVRALGDLKRLMRERQIDLVHAAGMKGILLGRLAARATGARAIIHLHDMYPPSAIIGCLQRWLAPGTHRALVVSNAVARFAVTAFRMPPERVQVLYNGIVVEEFAHVEEATRHRVRQELGFAPTDEVVGIVGRLLPVKDHPTLLRAMVHVRRVRPAARLLIVGDGPDRAACEALARGLDLQDAVVFAGQREDVARMVAAMDVVAMPSLHEGYPYAVLEALAAGKVVVATDVGGLPEIITAGRNGLLVPPSNPAALADALVEALTPGPSRNRLQAEAARSGQTHHVDQHVRQLEQIYLAAIDLGDVQARHRQPHQAPTG